MIHVMQGNCPSLSTHHTKVTEDGSKMFEFHLNDSVDNIFGMD